MTLRSIIEIRPAPGRFPIALQAAIAIGLPSVGFAIAGLPQLGLLASSGAFTALYFVDRTRRRRAATLPFVAAGLVLGASVGVATSGGAWTAAVGVGAFTLVSAVVMLGFGSGPPAALFFALVSGVSAHLAAPRAIGGLGENGALLIALVALGAVVAYAVVIAPLLIPAVRARDGAAHQHLEPIHFELDAVARVVLSRLGIAIALAVIAAGFLGAHRGYWVIVSVVAILQNGHRIGFGAVRAIHRVVGTMLGLGLFILAALVQPQGLALAALIVVLQFVVELLVVRNYGLALILITPLALVISAAGSTDPLDIARDRALDTVLGGGIALVVLLAAWALRRIRRT